MSGLKKRISPQKFYHFSEEEKRAIIEDYLQSGLTKKEIWKKYTGRDVEHGSLLRWMYEYGYFSDYKKKSVTFTSKNQKMNSKSQKQESEFEKLQLENRILELEEQLHDSEMKAISWKTMVEIAERELNISIKKKFNTKPLKK